MGLIEDNVHIIPWQKPSALTLRQRPARRRFRRISPEAGLETNKPIRLGPAIARLFGILPAPPLSL